MCSLRFEPRHEKTVFFAYAKTKTQISFAVTAKLISAFVFATHIVQSPYFLNFKPLDILCGRAALFVWDLVGNPKDRFSHNEAHLSNVDLIVLPPQLDIDACALPNSYGR